MTTADLESRPSLTRALLPLLMLAVAMVAGFMAMGSFGTVQEGAKAELGLSDYSLGLIQGLGAAVPLMLFSVPIGILVDRYRRVRLLIALASLWVAGTFLTAFADGVAMLFAARMLVGIGTTGALTAALSLAADLCEPAERGRAMLIVSLGKVIGISLAFAAGGMLYGLFAQHAMPGPLVGLVPWRGVHVVLGIATLILLFPLFVIAEPARQEIAASIHAPFRVVADELWSRRVFLIPLFVGQISVVMADTAAVIWAAPVLQRSYALRPDQFAGWMGLLLLATGIVGTILGGLAADIGHKSAQRGGILAGAVIAGVIGTPAALFAVGPTVTLFAIGLGVLAVAGNITGVITSVTLTVLIPNELRGLCIGAFIAIAGLIGYGIAPPLVAGVSGWLGGEQHLGIGLAIVGVLTSAVSIVAFIIAMRRAPVDAIAQPV